MLVGDCLVASRVARAQVLCSCTEASLGVEVAPRQSWGKQLLLLGLWTGTKKQEGFALGMQKKLY